MKELNFDDVLIKPVNTNRIESRKNIWLYTYFNKIYDSVIPVINANMTQTGNMDIAKILLSNNYLASLHKFYTNAEIIDFLEELKTKKLSSRALFITFGLREIEKMKEFAKISQDYKFSILLDVPNGYIEKFITFIRLARRLFPDRFIIAGNVCDYAGTKAILKAGADCVKVGINPGLSCRTKQTTGCGRKQLSAILDCAKAAKKYHGLICADGGCREIADICKAYVAGADFVMLGGMLAGSDEASGKTIIKTYRLNEVEEIKNKIINKYETKTYKEFYGMSSFHAQEENYGAKTKAGTSEGAESILIESTGPLENTLKRIEGGLRSCCSYTGSLSLKELKNAKFYI